MNRLDREASGQVEQKLQYLRTTVNDMRQAQTFGGSDLRIYSKTSGGAADISLMNLTSSTPQGILITVTPVAGFPVTLPAPILYFGFYNTTNPGNLTAYYAQTTLAPSGGSQQVQLWVRAASTTITQFDVYVTIWSLVPVTYTVAHL
jgi:hypothetical protein